MMESLGQTYDFASFEAFYIGHSKLSAVKMVSPADIANAVAFLTSPLADYVTGDQSASRWCSGAHCELIQLGR